MDANGNLIAVDLVSGGFGYTSPPQVQVIDPCNNGSGAVLQTILGDQLATGTVTGVQLASGNQFVSGVSGNQFASENQSTSGTGNLGTGNLGTGNLGAGNLGAGDLTGVVVQVIVRDSGQGYLPPPQTVPQYPAVLELTGVTVTNPGFNYGDTDSIEIIPSNGSVLSYDLDPFGKIKSVSVNKGGRFTELPRIKMNTETGLNAAFVPNFSIIRDPQPVDPVITQEDLVQVFDLVGLNINGYIEGKPYYGNVYYVNGIRYAGTSAQTSGTNIIVYDTRLASLQKRLDTVSTVTTGDVEEPVTEIETREDTVEAISSQAESYSTHRKCSINNTNNQHTKHNTSFWRNLFCTCNTNTSTIINTINSST